MSINIRQEPQSANMANANLLYVLTSTNTNEPQFQYVMEVSDGTNTYKFKQQPNPSDKAVFDMGQVASDFLGLDKVWDTTKYSTSTDSYNVLTPVFYEEYGTSTTSSVALYNGISGSSIYLLDGVVEPNSGDWDWDDSRMYSGAYRYLNGGRELQMDISASEYATLSTLNGVFDNGTIDLANIRIDAYNEAGTKLFEVNVPNTIANGGGPRTSYEQPFSEVSGDITDAQKLLHFGSGMKNLETVAPGVTGSDVSYYRVAGQTMNTTSFGLYTFEACGAPDFSTTPPVTGWGASFQVTGSEYQVGKVYFMRSSGDPTYTNYRGAYTCTAYEAYSGDDGDSQYSVSGAPRPGYDYYDSCQDAAADDGIWTAALPSAGVSVTYGNIFLKRYNVVDKECGYDRQHFAWLNEEGVLDYYSFTLAETKQDNITRETYENSFVPYSTGTNSATYDKSRRGTKVYSISTEETRRVESNYLSNEEVEYLRTLVESPEVFLQDGTDFIPVVITNSSFQYKTNPRSQKLYTLSLEYKVANNRRSR